MACGKSRDRELLFSVTIATGEEKVIGDVGKFRYGSPLGPAYRFSLAPDGKSLVYGTGQFKDNLVMLHGFCSPQWRIRSSEGLVVALV